MNVRKDPAFVDNPARPGLTLYLSLLRIFSAIGIIGTVACFFGESHWVADLFSQFKFQWAIGLGVLCMFATLARRWWIVLICMIGFAVNAFAVWPYYANAFGDQAVATEPVTDSESGDETAEFGSTSATTQSFTDDDAKPLRLMTLNVLTSNRNWDGVIEMVKSQSPDFVVFLEVDSTWEQVLREGLASDYPHSRYVSRLDNFGIAFLSKHRWSGIDVFNSQTLKLPSIDATFDGLGLAKPLRIIATHPIPPMSERNWNARNEQLFHVAGRFDSKTANIMTGDFNLSPWSPNFARVLEAGSLRDPAIECSESGPEPTWYVFPTWLGGLKLDHALISQDIKPSQLKIGDDVGSDHRAVIFDFR